MSFFGGLKRALGFSGDDDDEEDYITYESSVTSSPTESEKPDVEENNSVVDFNESDEIPEGVFDGLIEIVNANLSPMVLKCLDVDAEKKYLYEALGPKFSAFVKETRERSLSAARGEWDKEKGELNAKIEDFKIRCETAEQESREIKAMKVSEDRQKTALKERLRNLEDQVAAIEAEKEQYDLENKSLLNKLKVSQLRSEAVEEAEKEIVELKAEIARMKAQPVTGVPEEQVKALEDEYKAKMEINIALITEIRNEAAKNKEELEARNAELEELKNLLAQSEEKLTSANEELSQSKTELEAVKSELETTKAEASEMSENLSVLDDIQEQLEKVEEFKKKKSEEIQTLQARIAELEQEKAKVIEAVRDEDILKGRIAELELELSASNEKISSLAQENTDTLDMLQKRDEDIEAQKNELLQVKSEYEALQRTHEAEVNALKTAEMEKTKQFQAEIAELQAKLAVNGKIDDFLVDDDLRQAVDETFDVALDESDFDDFVTSIAVDNVTVDEVIESEAEVKSEEEPVEEIAEAELDDIDWLLPDTAEDIIKEEEAKKESQKKIEQEEEKVKSKKIADEQESQMSLFG